jgi:tetratricopeptide (TPR) repeat protein
MNYRTIFTAALILACAASVLLAQPAGQAPPAQAAQAAPAAQPASTSPVAKQPAFKSQEEQAAAVLMFQAMQGPDSDARVKTSEAFLQKFPDSEFKSIALFFLAMTYQEKNDYDKTLVYGEATLKAEPGNYQALLLLSRVIAFRVRENDLDKEEKLTTSEKYANQALEVLKTAPRPNPSITDAQWEQGKQDLTAQAYEAFALIALARKQNDVAIGQFKKALATTTVPDPATIVRLGNALAKAGQFDEAIATLGKVATMPEVSPAVKNVAAKEIERTKQAQAQAKK